MSQQIMKKEVIQEEGLGEVQPKKQKHIRSTTMEDFV